MKTLFFLLLTLTLFTSISKAQWVQQTSGTTQTLYSVSGALGGVVWACGANGTVLRSTNIGGTWQNVSHSLFASLDLYNICSVNESIALVTGSNTTGAFVYRTSNGGQNWTQIFFQAGGFINVIDINPFTINGHGFMQGDPVGGRWSLWKTTNAGTTWDSAGMYLPQAGSEAGWNNSGFRNHDNMFTFGTNNSRIYRTTNNGNTWGVQTTSEINSYSIWFNNFFINGISGGTQIITTNNGGNNWQMQTAPGTGNITGTTGAKDQFWFIRQGPGIYSSSNNGISWTTDTTIAGAQFLDMGIAIVFIPDDPDATLGYQIWAVGTGGRIYSTDYTTGINPISSNTPEGYSLSQNYPNPFNPSTKIRFDITRADFVSLKVYNSLGQEVARLVNENLAPGSYEVTFDGSGLNSGIYFYTIQTGSFTETKKMILVK